MFRIILVSDKTVITEGIDTLKDAKRAIKALIAEGAITYHFEVKINREHV